MADSKPLINIMSAPAIPNLNTLRRGGLRGRGRGRGAVSVGGAPLTSSKIIQHDAIVQNTDNDAATSRLSAVDAGYLEDPYARLMTSGDDVARRLPLMNRGTYVRTTGIDRVVQTFLSAGGTARKQIISLGAGSDTRYFRLKQKHRDLDVVYHEIDFEANTRRKIGRLRSPPFSAAAKNLAGIDVHAQDVEISADGASLTSPEYTIHPQDLRRLPQHDTGLPGIDKSLPTLIISECCLVYLPPDDADAVLQYFSNVFPSTTPLAIVIYEPIRPHDPFGMTMVRNLTSRGIQLQTLEKYAGLEEQRKRLEAHGFNADADGDGIRGESEAADIEFIWRQWVAPDEKERIDGLEWMDEVEEFVLLAQHYCISWGWRGFTDSEAWAGLLGPPK
ncbi:carboxy methyl transferase for protein phosphatase 2A [Exophiala xenobiotica]|nr:carboxy methyl transferase for protein phosphatase 2A [Exophiala xenobiotica]KAK5225089.1 carboxy methyl transferase for protein phosphatase 2A [Exophiala xenobiotica]KAK5250585.1 carboxy methyl transferase for protein phosphatase 2A [Exophiala xenobiotica]KAK5262347.1 carboxy methyl transferase for protein phosphatase 2A [Exophiala xenobiotica]KAK5346018.1 carboxy methyl transferase for protein phosphatase 2A [Exophiala xenobiotica]